MALLVDGLGYLTLGTPDPFDAAAFLTDICQLEVAEQRDEAVYLRGDARHHWIKLERRDEPGIVRVGYEVRASDARQEIRRRLDQRGITCVEGSSLVDDRIVGGFRFRDPNGIEIELYEEMAQFPDRPWPRGIRLEALLHAVFNVENVVATRDFWHDVLDFRRSDQVEDLACFMRCGNRYHHSVGFLRQPTRAGTLDHFCILVPHIDDVMRVLNVARRAGVSLEHEAVRHAASGSIGTYLQYPPLGMSVEFCTGHSRLEDDDPGHLLLATPWTVNLWNALPPERPGSWGAPTDAGTLGNVYEFLGDGMALRDPSRP